MKIKVIKDIVNYELGRYRVLDKRFSLILNNYLRKLEEMAVDGDVDLNSEKAVNLSKNFITDASDAFLHRSINDTPYVRVLRIHNVVRTVNNLYRMTKKAEQHFSYTLKDFIIY